MSQNLVDFFFFEFLFRSKQGCFGYFFLKKKIRSTGLTLLTHDYGLAPIDLQVEF
jgi:hypothetical protein